MGVATCADLDLLLIICTFWFRTGGQFNNSIIPFWVNLKLSWKQPKEMKFIFPEQHCPFPSLWRDSQWVSPVLLGRKCPLPAICRIIPRVYYLCGDWFAFANVQFLKTMKSSWWIYMQMISETKLPLCMFWQFEKEGRLRRTMDH